MIDITTQKMIKRVLDKPTYVSAVYTDVGVMLLNSRGQKMVN